MKGHLDPTHPSLLAAGRQQMSSRPPLHPLPTKTLCAAAAATMAVLDTKRRPSAAEEYKPRRGGRGRNCPSSAEESKDDRPAARNNQVRITSIDSYEILKKIGEGAYGAVWKARHIQSGQIVAMKSNINAGSDAAAALLREASMLAVCAANPAVVRLREVARGSDLRELHLIMDYVGRSLADVIRSRRCRGRYSFPESEACGAMAQLLSGISTMHTHGVVHCDLKPGNVLVSVKDGRLKICDLGLAKSVVAPPTDDLEGTLGYMAPELLLSQKDCGAPADIWALGCIMAEIIVGEPLFMEEDVCQQLISIINLFGIPDDISLMPLGVSLPSKLRERVSEEQLSPMGFDVLQGLLEYDPKNRLTADAALNMPWFEAKDY